MEQEPKIDVLTKGPVAILNIKGDVTTFAEKPIAQAYQKVTSEGSKKILLKFSPESFINSAGIAIIISLVSQARKKKQKVGITGLSNHFEKIFDIISLTDYVELYPSEENALKKL